MITTRLKNRAKQSSCRFKISAAAFDRKGILLGTSVNKPRFIKFGGGIHAEMSLIHQYKKRIKHITLCRIGKNGNFLPIEPCDSCRKVINILGISYDSVL